VHLGYLCLDTTIRREFDSLTQAVPVDPAPRFGEPGRMATDPERAERGDRPRPTLGALASIFGCYTNTTFGGGRDLLPGVAG
jgi:hypothetical protein